MYLNENQMGYFIQNVGLAAASFGVADDDITAVAEALNSLFNVRCAPPVEIIPEGEELQSICIAPSCPLAEDAVCSVYEEAYGEFMAPEAAEMEMSSSSMMEESMAPTMMEDVTMTATITKTVCSSDTCTVETMTSTMDDSMMTDEPMMPTDTTGDVTSTMEDMPTAVPTAGAAQKAVGGLAAGAAVVAMLL